MKNNIRKEKRELSIEDINLAKLSLLYLTYKKLKFYNKMIETIEKG